MKLRRTSIIFRILKSSCLFDYLLLFLEMNHAVMTEIDFKKRKQAIAQEYKELLRISYQTLTTEDKKLIRHLMYL
jgi:hypothetical protein